MRAGRWRQPADAKELHRALRRSTPYQEGPQLFARAPPRSCMANMMDTFPYKNRTEGQSPTWRPRRGPHRREFRDARRRHAQLHDRLHREVLQRRARPGRQVHDLGARVRDADVDGLELRDRDLGCVAELDRLCDELGLDTIETGAAIAVGWTRAAWSRRRRGREALLREIDEGAELAAIANGAVAIGKKRRERIPVVKGQAMPAWDPRTLKATGVTYCTSPMGADHTAGLIVMPAADGRARLAGCAARQRGLRLLGLLPVPAADHGGDAKVYTLLVGQEVTRERSPTAGAASQDEWAFNDGAGFTKADDDLPACMKEEGIGPERRDEVRRLRRHHRRREAALRRARRAVQAEGDGLTRETEPSDDTALGDDLRV